MAQSSTRQQLARDVVKPKALAKIVELLCRLHSFKGRTSFVKMPSKNARMYALALFFRERLKAGDYIKQLLID